MNINNIQLLIELIEHKKTGNPADLSKKLAVSERMIYKYLDILKTEFNAPIKYNRANQSYFFNEDGSIDLRWQEEEKKTTKN
jgi:transcriptional antiterminator